MGRANAETKNQQHNLLIHKTLKAFGIRKQKDKSGRFSNYHDHYVGIIPTCNIYKYPQQVLTSLDWGLHDISYANVVSFRYKAEQKELKGV